MTATKPIEAIDQLANHQRQLDSDGCMVGVSRQAVDETLAWIASLDAAAAEKKADARAIEQAWVVAGDGSRKNSITGEFQPHPERAPVQGFTLGIPWSMHLDAYDAYRKKWSNRTALIDWNGRGCRGGFGTEELDDLVPGWRDRVTAWGKMKSRIDALDANTEAMGEALAALSEKLRAAGFLDRKENHVAYEAVVKAWDKFS